MAKKANNPFARTLISNANMDPAQKFRIEEAYKSIRTNIMLSILKKGKFFGSLPYDGCQILLRRFDIRPQLQAQNRIRLKSFYQYRFPIKSYKTSFFHSYNTFTDVSSTLISRNDRRLMDMLRPLDKRM